MWKIWVYNECYFFYTLKYFFLCNDFVTNCRPWRSHFSVTPGLKLYPCKNALWPSGLSMSCPSQPMNALRSRVAKCDQWARAIKSSHAPPSFLIGRTTHTPKSFFIFVIYREPPKTREILAEKNKKLRIGGNLLINEMWNCVVEYQQQPNSLVDRPIRQETRAKFIRFLNSHN